MDYLVALHASDTANIYYSDSTASAAATTTTTTFIFSSMNPRAVHRVCVFAAVNNSNAFSRSARRFYGPIATSSILYYIYCRLISKTLYSIICTYCNKMPIIYTIIYTYIIYMFLTNGEWKKNELFAKRL